MQAEDIGEQDAEEDVLIYKGGSNRILVKIVQTPSSWFEILSSYYYGNEIKENMIGRACGTSVR